jgi:hypothetical protein
VGAGRSCAQPSQGGAFKHRGASKDPALSGQLLYFLRGHDPAALLAAAFGVEGLGGVFQCLLPWGWLGQLGVNSGLALDRSIALETSLESAFFGSTYQNLLAKPFYFDPNENRPLLLMNATRIVTGQRAVISPVLLKSDKGPEYPFAMYPLTEKGAPWLQLSTAAVISARFPVISPPARLSLGDGEPVSLVDGGYLDNTGALTAKAVLDEMKGLLDTEGKGPESQYKIHLIIPRFKNLHANRDLRSSTAESVAIPTPREERKKGSLS